MLEILKPIECLRDIVPENPFTEIFIEKNQDLINKLGSLENTEEIKPSIYFQAKHLNVCHTMSIALYRDLKHILRNTEIVNPSHYGDLNTYDLHISSHMVDNAEFGFEGTPVSETMYYSKSDRVLSIASELFRLFNVVEFSLEQIDEIDNLLGVKKQETNLVLGSVYTSEISDIDFSKILSLLGTSLDKVIILPMEFKTEHSLQRWEDTTKKEGRKIKRLSEGNLDDVEVLLVDTKGISDQIYASSGSKLSLIGGGFRHGSSHSPAESLMSGIHTLMGTHRADHQEMVYHGKSFNQLSELPENLVFDFIKVLLQGNHLDSKTMGIKNHLLKNNYSIYEKTLQTILERIYKNAMIRKNKIQDITIDTVTQSNQVLEL